MEWRGGDLFTEQQPGPDPGADSSSRRMGEWRIKILIAVCGGQPSPAQPRPAQKYPTPRGFHEPALTLISRHNQTWAVKVRKWLMLCRCPTVNTIWLNHGLSWSLFSIQARAQVVQCLINARSWNWHMNERTFVGKILISEGQTGNIHSFSCLVKVVPRRCEDRSLPLLMLGGAVVCRRESGGDGN